MPSKPKLYPESDSYVEIQITLNKDLHIRMHEVFRRRGMNKGRSFGSFYLEALKYYLTTERVPKQIDKITRSQFHFYAPVELKSHLDSITRIAKKRQVARPVILDEAITRYLDLPENHIGESFKTKRKVIQFKEKRKK